MATEVGSDFAHIQDEDMLRKMWQQTEDFGKKKEIRMRMYKLREQRLKEFYTTGEMIQTETTSKRSSTRTHTESITDQGFMTMKSKEIRDSESPTEEYQRQSNTNKNYYVSSKIDESDGSRGIVEIEQASSLKPNEDYTQNTLQTSMSSSTSTKWRSSQTTISVSEEVQKADVNLNSKFIVNEQNNEDSQLTFDTSYNNSDSSNIDSKVIESISTTNLENIKRDDNNQYSDGHQKVIETYTSSGELFEPVSENKSNKDGTLIENTYISNISSNKSENVEVATDSKIINELHKLDSYLSTQQSTTDSSTKSNSIVSNDDKINKKVDDKGVDTSKEYTEGQYITTHQHSYQPPRISVDLSPSHDAFARSLRSTPERSSPSPSRERTSPERRFKSASPEKYRASPEKAASPSKSLNYSSRRRLSSTHTKGLSKKRSNTPTRGEKYDSSDDSDCSGATHGTYDKYKSCDAKKTLFKEENKITSTSKYGQKSSSTSPVRREKSPGYSSEGSVGKEVRKSSSKVKNSSHESSPERSAFKPVNNFKTIKTQQITQDNKINHATQEDNVHTNNYDSKNKINEEKHLIKVITPEIDNDLNEKKNENTEQATKNTENNILNSKKKSNQEKFITEEQVRTSIEQVDSEKITTDNIEISKSSREKSPSKSVKKENKTKQEEFIENEKSKVAKQSTIPNDVITIRPKEKSPVKEVKPVTKDTKTYTTVKSSENMSYSSDIKSVTPTKKTISAIPSSIPSPIKKVVPSTLEKTPSKKTLIHKDSKDSVSNKTVKKDLSREKMDVKITRSDSKTLIHKNSKERITQKTVIKKPSQEFLVDKKTTISSRQKVTTPDTKSNTLETIKVLEKKDSKNKLKPSISPQSSQKKLGVVKSIAETKTVIDSKKTIGNINSKRIHSLNVTKPRTHTSPKPDINETPSKVTKPYTKPISTSSLSKPQIKKTTYSHSNTNTKKETTKNEKQKSKDLEDELPPENFESDTDLDDSTNKPKYIKKVSSNSSTSSSSSEDDEEEREDKRKIQDIDSIRIEAEEEYGKKMTNKDALLNVIVQLPPSSRESSPEYSTRFGQPYCSVSDDASLPRYADVVSEPEDANDYSLHCNRYDVVTDLDEESSVTVADRVSKFLNNVNKQEEIQKTEIPQSPQAVRKTKQIFESIAKGKIEETDINDVIKSETIDIETKEVHDLSKVNNTPSSLLTRKISGASDYQTRKDFFENKKSKDVSEKVTHLTPTKITRSSSIKDRRASFETKIDQKTPLKDKTNVPRTKSPEAKSSSPDRTTKTPIKISKTETVDVKVEEINRSRRLSGSKTVKDRTATFEKNEPTQKSYKENKTTFKHQVPSTPLNTSKISETRIKSATVADTKTVDRVLTKRVRSPEKLSATDSVIKTNESTIRKASSKSPDRKMTETPKRSITTKSPDRQITETPKRNSITKSPDRKIAETPKRNSTAKSPERSVSINTRYDTSGNQSARDTISSSSRQRATITTAKTEFGVTVKSTSTPKTTITTTTTTTKSIPINNADDEVQIEEIFDLLILETMLEKAVGYDRRRRIRAQIRVVKRQLETNSGKATNTTTRVTKNFQDVLPVKTQKQSNVTVQKTEYVKKAEIKKERSVSPQKSYANPIGNLRSPSPQKTLRSVVETRTPLSTQKAVRTIENERSPSPQKTVTSTEKVQTLSSQKVTPIEKVRSPSPQKSTPTEKARSPSPKKVSVVQQQQDSRFNKNEKSSRNSTITSTSTTVTKTTKVKSEQVNSSTNLYQEQNVTDLITSSYGVGPTDDNGRPLFGLRALRKNNATQLVGSANDSSSTARCEAESRHTQVSDQKHKSFGLKALQSENTYTVQESSSTVYQTGSDQKGGVDQLITDHKGKPLFGLKALQSIGKNEDEPIYDDMPEPPVSPQLKDLVLKHEKHAKESSKLDLQPRQKPKAKFRDSFILDTKDEGLYSTFEENGFTDPNEITALRSIIKKTEDDQNNETIVKSKSQSTVFQSKSVMRSDGSGNVSVTQDFLKGELSSVNEQEPSGKLTRGHYTYQSPDNLDSKKGIAKVTTVTTAIGKDTGPQITEITEELSDNDRVDGNKVVKRSRTNDKFENIQKRFSQESFNQDSRRSSKELNGYEKPEESPQSTPRSSLVRGDSIKALQHKFQQATVSSSLKQNRTAKSDVSSSSRQVEEKTVTTKVNTTKNSGTATSFLDNNSRVTGVQDVLTRMRNADLVVESGDTNEDIEARALLNKFLGASVILHGMEQGNKSPASINTTSSASLVNQVEKQRAQKSPVIRKNLNEQELDNIWDEKQLQILLESCPDYDQRRKIRARLRQIMAEQKEVTETNSTSVSTKTGTGSYVKTEVHTRTTTSSNRLTKANSVSSSPFAKFQQLERQNSAPNSQTRPCYKFTDPALARSASSIKDRLLNWVKAQTKEYKNLQITNFSTCWSDGLAFCALIHHFYPEAFDYDKLTPEKRRENFEIAFKVAEDEAGIAPLLDVEDMVVMRKPDWKCVFTYVQTFYRRFHNDPRSVKPSYFEG
ncbi:serine-rich adhesin for platelets-like isoform X2 [Myzus persicae]|uniref:serine-rich adhesin for platelets-like isoform X2 n=1 Tax=Myzus persicae TaxID=13164 RepID=UPI000B932614|nr:serine-rich adhesin for platelets-like isoform X2 [Myzus persicae]